MPTQTCSADPFPVHDELDVVHGETIYKTTDWWKAAVLYESFGDHRVGVYLWKRTDHGWKRQQKYSGRSVADWYQDKMAIEALLEDLAQSGAEFSTGD